MTLQVKLELPGPLAKEAANNETAAVGRRWHFDITLRGQAGRAR